MRTGSFFAGLLLGAGLVAAAWAIAPPPAAEGPHGASGPARRDEPAGALEPETLLLTAHRELVLLHDPTTACGLLERALALPLTPAQRVRALIALGTAQRSAGDHATSVKTLRKVLAVSDLPDERRAYAEFQLMWTYRLQGDLDAAVRTGESLVSRGTMRSGLGAATHRALGLFAREVGNLDRSRREFERAVEVARDDPALRNFREEILGWLHSE